MSAHRPDRLAGEGLQHERTALAWERTAVSIVGVGLLLTRVAADQLGAAFAAVGLVQVALGAAMVVWTGWHYAELHDLTHSGESPTHPLAARVVGVSTCVFVTAALAVAIAVAVR
jgi:uncharacterized membrane protein YidH (DUF202 family)